MTSTNLRQQSNGRTTSRQPWAAKVLLGLVAVGLLSGLPAVQAQDEPLGVQVPEGFEVTQFADDELAHDIFSMTIDARGRVVVSGTGYVKILTDTDGDGKADRAIPYADGPETGAQGMYFIGTDLLCSGDAGLIRYRDRNGDDRADGPPEVFLRVHAGNEHDLHAIRKGPDGWWYMIAGNFAGVTDRYISLPTSPVKHPQAGTILRLAPDLAGGEVYAHGFRNSYDFDFSASGDLFAFDSDDERDVSLPWYLPTRVFHVLPGSHQGWVSQSYKRPDYFFDMPPVLGDFGRGSPTGVICYRHDQFPEKYQGALFVLDWTYGRVMALPLQPSGSTWATQPVDFMTAVGQHGFAPTDVEVGPDGSLYVCVGGRGTRGGVYRIRAKGRTSQFKVRTASDLQAASPAQKLKYCLSIPHPLSSWARASWEPIVRMMPATVFQQAAVDQSLTADQRVRAIEILTERFGGLGSNAAAIAKDPSPLVRARAAWSIGRVQPAQPDVTALQLYLADSDPLVVRNAMEALGAANPATFETLVQPLGEQLANPDKFVRQAAMRALERPQGPVMYKMAEVGYSKNWRATIPVAAASSKRTPGFSAYALDVGQRILTEQHPDELKLEALRVLQLGLGDLMAPGQTLPPIYDGYASSVDLKPFDQQLDSLRVAIAEIYPSGKPHIDHELERVIAMIQPANDQLLEQVLSFVTAESSPIEDIHRLIVISRLPVAWTSEQREKVADTLLALEPKIKARHLRQDSNWSDRVLEMYQALAQRDSQLPAVLLEQPEFGAPGDVQFMAEVSSENFDRGISRFAEKIQSDPNYEWNTDVIYLLNESRNESERNLIRQKIDDFALRNAVLMALSSEPEEQDRMAYVNALDSAPLEVVQASLQALALLGPTDSPQENVALVRTLRQLGSRGEERQARDLAAELLGRNLKEDHGYAFGQDGNPQQAVIAAWTTAMKQKFPEEFARQSGDSAGSIEQLVARLGTVPWNQGDLRRGHDLFNSRGCVQCHGARRALGPDLSGVTNRFSRDDLFIAIAFPNRDVSPRYQTTQIATVDGHVRTGLIVYESVDGLVLRDANNQTYRIETDEIDVRRQLSQSLMPAGLIKGLTDQDLADLYAYLRNQGQGLPATAGNPNGRE